MRGREGDIGGERERGASRMNLMLQEGGREKEREIESEGERQGERERATI